MINGFSLRRGLRTHPAQFVSKFLFIRVIRVIRGFNCGSRVKFMEQCREVMRFHRLALRTEETLKLVES
jgi:hypothetical protein